jgi:hypothetical protein
MASVVLPSGRSWVQISGPHPTTHTKKKKKGGECLVKDALALQKVILLIPILDSVPWVAEGELFHSAQFP